MQKDTKSFLCFLKGFLVFRILGLALTVNTSIPLHFVNVLIVRFMYINLFGMKNVCKMYHKYIFD